MCKQFLKDQLRNITILTLMFCGFSLNKVHAQIENVIVEKYYISDTLDATDTTGGYLAPGSTTYRVFIDLATGYKVKKIYGDAGHALKIASTTTFFNNISEGLSFSKDMVKSRLSENTVALDTWLTIGQITKTASGKAYFGIEKKMDTLDASFIGGSVNNDGGSAGISSGLLINADTSAGFPLTKTDGYTLSTKIPSGWASFGFLDLNSGVDSTIFGSAKPGTIFISNDALLQCSGVSGVTPENKVLVAQLTTKGELSFELNLDVLDSANNVISCVAKLSAGDDPKKVKLIPLLTYPPPCGCRDPQYLEYDPAFACNDNNACVNKIVFGCMDVMACNYDSTANFNIPVLCCYPGNCNGRDISFVCPKLSINENDELKGFELFPNPAQNFIEIKLGNNNPKPGEYKIYDVSGNIVVNKSIVFNGKESAERIDITSLSDGIYLIKVNIETKSFTKHFVKN